MTKKQNILIAAGGTGGHVFPALSLADMLKNRGYNPILVTDERSMAYLGDNLIIESKIINTKAPGKSMISKLVAAWKMGIGFMQAKSLIRKTKPVAAIGFGGYPSFPTMLAAVRMSRRHKIFTAIHEQNSLLGHANQILSPNVDAIATSYEHVIGVERKLQHKITQTGNPVRAAICEKRNTPFPKFEQYDTLNILVTGGSQGAHIFADIVPNAVAKLPDEYRDRVKISQQCKESDIDKASQIYSDLGINFKIKSFFDDMPERLAAAHLVICRSGASTLAELLVVGRPAIMVPFPYAKDDHQTINANSVESVGGGWLIPESVFTPESLSEKLINFFELPDLLTDAAKASYESGKVDACESLANLIDASIDKNR